MYLFDIVFPIIIQITCILKLCFYNSSRTTGWRVINILDAGSTQILTTFYHPSSPFKNSHCALYYCTHTTILWKSLRNPQNIPPRSAYRSIAMRVNKRRQVSVRLLLLLRRPHNKRQRRQPLHGITSFTQLFHHLSSLASNQGARTYLDFPPVCHALTLKQAYINNEESVT